MTLSKFLTKYIYIPLGGNRKGPTRTYINIFIIFFISGVWHGAGWTFILWGICHGLASIVNRYWKRAGFTMNKFFAWFITFQFVNATWVLFRAPSLEVATNVLQAMVGLNGVAIPQQLQEVLNIDLGLPIYTYTLTESVIVTLMMLLVGLLIAVFAKNSLELSERMKPNFATAIFCSTLFIYTLFKIQQVSEFLYFNF